LYIEVTACRDKINIKTRGAAYASAPTVGLYIGTFIASFPYTPEDCIFPEQGSHAP
jgi:hypothetical protein